MLPAGAYPLVVARSEGRKVADKFCFPSFPYRNVAAWERQEAIAALDKRYRPEVSFSVP